MKLDFTSLGRPGIGYRLLDDTSCWDQWYRGRDAYLSLHAAEFPTYGDVVAEGERFCLIQHASETLVTSEHAADWGTSLAEFVKELRDSDAIAAAADFATRHSIGPACADGGLIAFLLTKATYAESKIQRYYCPSTRKVSSAPTRSFDKRWFAIGPEHDGTTRDVVLRLIGDRRRGVLELYALATRVRQVRHVLDGSFGEHPGEVAGLWTRDDNPDHEKREGLEAALLALEAACAMESLTRCLSAARRNSAASPERLA